MPLISYQCSCKKCFTKYFKSAKDAPKTINCECGQEAKKIFGTTSSSHLTVIDNGLMARKLEIDPNIQEINDQRSVTNFSEDD